MITASEARIAVMNSNKTQHYLKVIDAAIRLHAKNGEEYFIFEWEDDFTNNEFKLVVQTLVNNGFKVTSIPANYNNHPYGGLEIHWNEI